MGKALISGVSFVLVWVVASFVYLATYNPTIVEQKCVGGFFIQIEQYSAYNRFFVGLLGVSTGSEGSLKITYSNGTKDYISSVSFLGEGNQKVALFDGRNRRWSRYVFGNAQIFEGTKPFQCN